MSLSKKCCAEFLGTAALTFAACGVAVIADDNSWWISTALAFGLVIVAMAYSIGNISGCHINPAVSFAMAISKRMTWKEFGAYVVSQIFGAFFGSGLLGLCLRKTFTTLGGNEIQDALKNEAGEIDKWSYLAAFAVEIILTFIFVMAILGVTDSRFHKGAKNPGLVIGLTLTLVHLVGLGFTGTSVNPARSIAPAVLQAIAKQSASLNQCWIWILAPMVGAALAAGIYGSLTSEEK
ncbi:MAG: aquaporin [Clostridia bacterium]|nr:aquaporin [Clostridia bacterium]